MGDFLREEMGARGWSQADLAKIIGRSDRDVHALLSGKLPLKPETATLLGDAFGTSPEYWMNLETAYKAWHQSRDTRDAVSRKGRLYEVAPVRQMQKRGWIPVTENVDALERHVMAFYGVSRLEALKRQALPFAARMGDYSSRSASVCAWIARAKNLAQAVTVTRQLSPGSLSDCLARLRLLLAEAVETRHVPRVLAEHGIRFLIVEHLPHTRIDGACLWLNRDSPVVVLSMRYERLDWFWFTLLHELKHVAEKDGLETLGTVDNDLVGKEAVEHESKPPEERAADQFATQFLVPQDQIENFIARVRPLYSKDRIRTFAQRINVHPALVVGQLQFRKEIPYYHSREMLRDRVRRIVTTNSLTDGWDSGIPAL